MRDYIPQPGDILAFSGRDWVSRLIQVATLSRISHVGVVFERWDSSAGEYRCYLAESTSLSSGKPCEISQRPIDGVQAHRVEDAIADYDGSVYVARLSWQLDSLESSRLTSCALGHMGVGYDWVEAPLSATRIAKYIWEWIRAPTDADDAHRLFCSEFALMVLKSVNRVPKAIRPKWYSPGWMLFCGRFLWRCFMPLERVK